MASVTGRTWAVGIYCHPLPAVRSLGSGRGPGGCVPGAAVPDPDGPARPLHLLQPGRPARSRALHPFRDPDDRRDLRRSRHRARRAGAGVPPRRLVRRRASGPPRRDPRRRRQQLLHPLRRRVSRAATSGLQDDGALRGRVVERRRASAAFPSRRLDAHAAARPRVLPPGPFESRGWRRSVSRQRELAAALRDPGCPRHEQAPPEAGRDPPVDLARAGDAQQSSPS
jgi:hypothetical protein